MPDSPTHTLTTHDLHHHHHHHHLHLHLHPNETNNNQQSENLHKNTHEPHSQIPFEIEIISEEEMALIEAAFSLARSSSSCTALPLSPRLSLSNSIAHFSKRALPALSGSSGSVCDVEDSCQLRKSNKKCKVPQSPLSRFRRKKGLFVTDITATEWCEKQMEFVLQFGKPELTNAMKAGISRHAKLEEEVIKKVEVRVESLADIWALKFMNFIVCANQLLFEGLTREVPV